MATFNELMQGLGQGFKYAGGALAPEVFEANVMDDRLALQREDKKRELILGVLVNAVQNGALDAQKAAPILSRYGIDIPGLGPSAAAQENMAQAQERKAKMEREQAILKERADRIARIEKMVTAADMSDKEGQEERLKLQEEEAKQKFAISDQTVPDIEVRPMDQSSYVDTLPGTKTDATGAPVQQPGVATQGQNGSTTIIPGQAGFPGRIEVEQARKPYELEKLILQDTLQSSQFPEEREQARKELLAIQKLEQEQKEKEPKQFTMQVGDEEWTVIRDPDNIIKERVPTDPRLGVLAKGKPKSLVSVGVNTYERAAAMAGVDQWSKQLFPDVRQATELKTRIARAKMVTRRGTYSGTAANFRKEFMRALETAGFVTREQSEKIANSDAFQSDLLDTVLSKVKELRPASNIDLTFVQSMVARLEQNPEARLVLLDYLEAEADQAIKDYDEASAYLVKHNHLIGWKPSQVPVSQQFYEDERYKRMMETPDIGEGGERKSNYDGLFYK